MQKSHIFAIQGEGEQRKEAKQLNCSTSLHIAPALPWKFRPHWTRILLSWPPKRTEQKCKNLFVVV